MRQLPGVSKALVLVATASAFSRRGLFPADGQNPRRIKTQIRRGYQNCSPSIVTEALQKNSLDIGISC